MKLAEIGLDSKNIFYMPPFCEEHGIDMELDLEQLTGNQEEVIIEDVICDLIEDNAYDIRDACGFYKAIGEPWSILYYNRENNLFQAYEIDRNRIPRDVFPKLLDEYQVRQYIVLFEKEPKIWKFIIE